MRSDEDVGQQPDDPGGERFAGDLFLRLATDGVLVLPREQAERVIAELERTLEVVRARLRRGELSRRLRDASGGDIPPDVERLTVDATFACQISSGKWEQALVELPKYIEAFRIAAGMR